MKVCWCDLETTGTDSKRCGIWQAAFLIEIDRVVKDKKNFLMYPRGKDVESGAKEMMRVPLEELRTSVPLDIHVKDEIKRFLEKYVDPFNKFDKFTFAGYNTEFDIGFLEQLWEDTQDKYFRSFFTYFPLDVMRMVTIAVWMNVIEPPKNMQLSTIASHVGIPFEEGEAHDALADIVMTRDIACLLRRKMYTRRRLKE